MWWLFFGWWLIICTEILHLALAVPMMPTVSSLLRDMLWQESGAIQGGPRLPTGPRRLVYFSSLRRACLFWAETKTLRFVAWNVATAVGSYGGCAFCTGDRGRFVLVVCICRLDQAGVSGTFFKNSFGLFCHAHLNLWQRQLRIVRWFHFCTPRLCIYREVDRSRSRSWWSRRSWPEDFRVDLLNSANPWKLVSSQNSSNSFWRELRKRGSWRKLSPTTCTSCSASFQFCWHVVPAVVSLSFWPSRTSSMLVKYCWNLV